MTPRRKSRTPPASRCTRPGLVQRTARGSGRARRCQPATLPDRPTRRRQLPWPAMEPRSHRVPERRKGPRSAASDGEKHCPPEQDSLNPTSNRSSTDTTDPAAAAAIYRRTFTKSFRPRTAAATPRPMPRHYPLVPTQAQEQLGSSLGGPIRGAVLSLAETAGMIRIALPRQRRSPKGDPTIDADVTAKANWASEGSSLPPSYGACRRARHSRKRKDDTRNSSVAISVRSIHEPWWSHAAGDFQSLLGHLHEPPCCGNRGARRCSKLPPLCSWLPQVPEQTAMGGFCRIPAGGP